MSLKRLHKLVELEKDYQRFHRLEYDTHPNREGHGYRPYAAQFEFHAAGKNNNERMLSGCNQGGKTYTTSAENAFHLTGRYDIFHKVNGVEWPGRRFYTPIHMWALGESGEQARDLVQMQLFGGAPETDNWGTGWIPLEDLGTPVMSRTTSGLIDYCPVRHYTNGKFDGWSYVWIKSYGKGRSRLSGKPLHVVNCDEEPPTDVYGELLPRTNTTNGLIYVGFTGMRGYSQVVRRFKDPESTQTKLSLTKMGILDIPDAPHGHYTREEKASIIMKYPKSERAARAHGEIHAGAGLVYAMEIDRVQVKPFTIPDWWPKLNAIDFGFSDHPTALAWGAFDTDSNPNLKEATCYIYRGYRETEPSHANVVSANRSEVPVAWPVDGLQQTRGRDSAVHIAKLFNDEGLHMIGGGTKGPAGAPNYAHFPDGTNGLQSGIDEMRNLMLQGKFKVFSNVYAFWDEFGMYHYDEKGNLVSLYNDFLDACRYLIMMRRRAVVIALKPETKDKYRRHRNFKGRYNHSWMAA